MKKRLLLFLSSIIFVGIILFLFFSNSSLLSSDQENSKKLFGVPDYFVITYLPRGENELVRSESWYFINANKKIDFLGGRLVENQDWTPDGDVESTELLPEYFDFEQNYQDVKEILEGEQIEELDYLPPFYSDNGGVKTYYCNKAIFVIENDHLTYFQTVGVGDKDYYESELNLLDAVPTQTPQPSHENFETYSSSDLGFEMEYPTEWFLEYGVMSSYDIGYLEKGLTLPEKRLKCDFFKYNPDDVEIENKVEIISGETKVSKGLGITQSSDGLGLGDGVMFLIEKNEKSSMSLLCYSYNSEFETKLIESLKTFRFLE